MFTWVCLGFNKVLDILTDVGYFQVLWAMAIGCFSKMFGPFLKVMGYWVFSHAYPYVWAQGMRLSFGAPK